MSNQQVATARPIDEFRSQLSKMAPEFQMALPSHISVEKFQRVTLTAVNGDPALLNGDRRSLFQACVQCAQDGLLPDKREAAFVMFKQTVQYMPMVTGIIKRCRNSGDIAWIKADCVYSADEFSHYTDEKGEHFRHVPSIDGESPGTFRGAYAAALTSDGTLYFDFLTLAEINKIKGVSRSGNNGPWGNWFDEMAKKSAIRRLAKRLPMSTDQETLMHRDDDMYDMDAPRETIAPPAPPPRPTRESVRAAEETARQEDYERNRQFRDTMREEPRHATAQQNGAQERQETNEQTAETQTDQTPHDKETGKVIDNNEDPRPDATQATPPGQPESDAHAQDNEATQGRDTVASPSEEHVLTAKMLIEKFRKVGTLKAYNAIKTDYAQDIDVLRTEASTLYADVMKAMKEKDAWFKR